MGVPEPGKPSGDPHVAESRVSQACSPTGPWVRGSHTAEPTCLRAASLLAELLVPPGRESCSRKGCVGRSRLQGATEGTV